MKKFLFNIILLLILLPLETNGATKALFVGQSFQTEISAVGYHYISVESISCSNPSISVSNIGLVVKATINSYFIGEATVKVKLRYQLYAGQNYQYREEVFSLSCIDTSITISPTSTKLEIGKTMQLSYGFNRATHATPSIYWSSSDESICKVSSTGIVTGIKEGTATIYVESNLGSNRATCSVQVFNKGLVNSDESNGNESLNIDTNWYNQQSKEYHLSTTEELLGLRKLVNSGNNMMDKIIYIDNDIDLTSLNWITPIGINDKFPFCGIFDAQNHTILFNINTETSTEETYSYYGLFGYNRGLIRNLKAEGKIDIEINSFRKNLYIGGIVGFSDYYSTNQNGTIENCLNKVNIEFNNNTTFSNLSHIGGISGYLNGSRCENCINIGEIKDLTNKIGNPSTNFHYIGGIVGVSWGGDIIYCFNKNIISCLPEGSNNINTFIGGLVGSLALSGRCLYSANIGNVYSSSDMAKLGGIVGVVGSEKNVIIGCYVGCEQIGDILGKTKSNSYIGSLGGDTNSRATYENNYVANDIIVHNSKNGRTGDMSFSREEMKTKDFVNILNANYSSACYIGWDGFFPLPKINLLMTEYFITTVSEVTTSSALLESNVYEILGNNISNCGFLISQDDGKEYYRQCENGKYSYLITDLEPNREYNVRWYAQDKYGIEYYGSVKTFKTKALNPITLHATEVFVSSSVINGEFFYDKISKYGFYYIEKLEDSLGEFVWANSEKDGFYSFKLQRLKPNTKYIYKAVIDINGIYFEGEEMEFTTCSVATLLPSNFTDDAVTLNGEIGIEGSNAYFEYRASAWPSVINGEQIKCENYGMVSAQLLNPIIGETYKYRLVVETNEETIKGEWIEFTFEPNAGIKSFNDNNDMMRIFNLNGIEIQSNDITKLPKGIYIVKKGKATYKILR